MDLQYIRYNSGRCTRSAGVCTSDQLVGISKLPRSPRDSMGVGAVKIRHIAVPDHHRRHREARKRIPATPVAFGGMSLCVREVEIINAHVFTHYYWLH